MKRGIYFEVSSSEFSDWIEDLRDPALLRFAETMPPAVSELIRHEHIRRLSANVEHLRAKQAEFHARVDEYVAQLEALRARLESSAVSTDATRTSDPCARRTTNGVLVRCLACECESSFESLELLFARESEDSFSSPTWCYVEERGEIKKGVFACASCGAESICIRTGPLV